MLAVEDESELGSERVPDSNTKGNPSGLRVWLTKMPGMITEEKGSEGVVMKELFRFQSMDH